MDAESSSSQDRFLRFSILSLILFLTLCCFALTAFSYLADDRKRFEKQRNERGWTTRVELHLNDNRDHVLLADLCSRSTLTHLWIDGRFEKRDIRSVGRAKWLTSLSIDTAAMTADDIRSLRALLPDCHIYIRCMEPPVPAK